MHAAKSAIYEEARQRRGTRLRSAACAFCAYEDLSGARLCHARSGSAARAARYARAMLLRAARLRALMVRYAARNEIIQRPDNEMRHIDPSSRVLFKQLTVPQPPFRVTAYVYVQRPSGSETRSRKCCFFVIRGTRRECAARRKTRQRSAPQWRRGGAGDGSAGSKAECAEQKRGRRASAARDHVPPRRSERLTAGAATSSRLFTLRDAEPNPRCARCGAGVPQARHANCPVYQIASAAVARYPRPARARRTSQRTAGSPI